jgi:sugar phosphate isomerase/epimerase
MRVPIGIQLYTLREESEADFPAVLERLGRIGYQGVEPAGLHGLSPGEFNRHLGDAGLEVTSAHAPPPVGKKANKILDELEAIGAPTAIVAFLPPERFADMDAVRAVAAELNEAHENAKKREIQLGYHNHWWEFETRIDGRSAHAALFDLLDPEICAEVDVYWAQVGGEEPVKVLGALGARATLLHVKDGPADDRRSDMTAVGGGVLDIEGILAAGNAAEWHIVELDRCATDMFEAVEQSYEYLVGEGLSEGKREIET